MKFKYPISYLLISILLLISTVLVTAFTNITKTIYKGFPYYMNFNSNNINCQH